MHALPGKRCYVLLFSVGLLSLTVGCGNLDVTIQCDSPINNFGLTGSEGRPLRMALLSLSQKHFDRLAESEDVDKDRPWTSIDARQWFAGPLQEKIRRIISEEGAIDTFLVSSGQTVTRSLRPPPRFAKHAGVLVLADFAGVTDDNKGQFETSVWVPAKFFKRKINVRVSGTTLTVGE